MNLEKIKRVFLQILIGCLVAASGLAVVTVLIGKFNDVLIKALLTLLIIAVHSLVSFGFILSNERRKTIDNLEIFINATFIIIVLSFITSIFGIWKVIDVGLVGKLYLTYGVLLFAILHSEVLAKTLKKEKYIDNIVFSNYAFMIGVVLMILPVIFFTGYTFSSAYFRLLAAFGIIDATLTLLAVILHKLYLQKHPRVDSAVFTIQQAVPSNGHASLPQQSQPKRGMNVLVMILIGFLALQFIGSIFLVVIGKIVNH
jgi:hypothetical protein